MKIYIWEQSEVGGGYNLVVAAEDLENARDIVRKAAGFDSLYGKNMIKPEPKVIELDVPKLITYFDYYE